MLKECKVCGGYAMSARDEKGTYHECQDCGHIERVCLDNEDEYLDSFGELI